MGMTPAEQARLRKAVGVARRLLSLDMPCPTAAASELLAAAEAMLPERDAWADFSVCDITVDTDKQTPMATLTYDGYIQALVSLGEDYIADRDQAIRAAVLLKHSKRLMEAIDGSRIALESIVEDINAEAERVIREAGV